MNKKKILFLTLCSAATVAATIAVTSSYKNSNGLRAAGETTWKHFSAVMPTANESGIREYWTNCVGGAPVFEEPKDVVAAEANLTTDQINAILADKSDPRIIPSLTRIQNAVNKHADGFSASDYTFVYDALGYTYLDGTTKAGITGANEAAILSAKTEFERYFKVIYDVAKDALPVKDQSTLSFEKGYDEDKGDVLLVTTTAGLSGKSSEIYFYGLNQRGVTYGENDTISFSVYSPFAAEANTSQTYWCGTYQTAKKFTANPSSWTSITGTGTDFNSNGAFVGGFNSSVSLQRYVNGTIDPFQGTYKMTSIIVEKAVEGMGKVVQSVNLLDKKTWGDENAVITSVRTGYGHGSKVSIANKSTVFEGYVEGFASSSMEDYNYAVLYVKAPKTPANAFYVSQESWRNKVMNIGVSPTDPSNGTVADSEAVRKGSALLKEGWNKIVIPKEYMQYNGRMFFEIWNNASGTGEWIITDLFGYNDPNDAPLAMSLIDVGKTYGENANLDVEYNSTIGAHMFSIDVAETQTADRFATSLNNTDLSGVTSIDCYVKAPNSGSQFAVYQDGVTGTWWPFVAQKTLSVSNTEFTKVSYSLDDLDTETFDITNITLKLLFLKSGGPSGIWQMYFVLNK